MRAMEAMEVASASVRGKTEYGWRERKKTKTLRKRNDSNEVKRPERRKRKRKLDLLPVGKERGELRRRSQTLV